MESWRLLRAGMRLLCVDSTVVLWDWCVRRGYASAAVDGHVNAHIQVALLGEAHQALQVGDLFAAPAMEDVYIGVAMHLAGRDDIFK